MTGPMVADPVTDAPTASASVVSRRPGGVTVWLTGLPSAGKTTLAVAVGAALVRRGVDVHLLDGDEIRTNLSAGLGFSRADRHTQGTRIGYVAELLARHGVVVLVPVIAPYQATRDEIAARHADAGTDFVLVHLSTPLDVCADRDVKGLYAKAFRGEISSMTGVDDPYEVPDRPDLRIDTSAVSVDESVEQILALLAERGVA